MMLYAIRSLPFGHVEIPLNGHHLVHCINGKFIFESALISYMKWACKRMLPSLNNRIESSEPISKIAQHGNQGQVLSVSSRMLDFVGRFLVVPFSPSPITSIGFFSRHP
jgi:hypothetical protein